MQSQSPLQSQQTAIFLLRCLAGDGSARDRALRFILSAGGGRTAVTIMARLACISIIRDIDIQRPECEHISDDEQHLISLIADLQSDNDLHSSAADAILLQAAGDAAKMLSRLGIFLTTVKTDFADKS